MDRRDAAPAERIDLLGRLLRAQVRAGDVGGRWAARPCWRSPSPRSPTTSTRCSTGASVPSWPSGSGAWTCPNTNGPLAADVLALALARQGNLPEARAARQQAPPIRADYFFPVFATFRAMAMAALGEQEGARDLYEALLPHAGGPPAGAGSMSVALPPPAHALGELSRLLGDERTARAHFTRAAQIATRWGAQSWAATSRRAAS
ncbi:hypothetical protein [Nonomuraea typhae]|uniref:hypothetical protein n=1 Tax=Nonomuraea typhae TaxID=2603600 RepID=UPI0012F8AC8F|nr:hypothetical protein [Nonomuraea typhae]